MGRLADVWEQRLGESPGGESEGMSVAGAACIEGEVDTAVREDAWVLDIRKIQQRV